MVSAVIKGVYRQPRERAPHPGEGSGRVPGEGLGLECLGRPEEATRAAEARGGGGAGNDTCSGVVCRQNGQHFPKAITATAQCREDLDVFLRSERGLQGGSRKVQGLGRLYIWISQRGK